MCYYVIDLATGREVYMGDSEALAAKNLKPGTHYGKGRTLGMAKLRAQDWRDFFNSPERVRKGLHPTL